VPTYRGQASFPATASWSRLHRVMPAAHSDLIKKRCNPWQRASRRGTDRKRGMWEQTSFLLHGLTLWYKWKKKIMWIKKNENKSILFIFAWICLCSLHIQVSPDFVRSGEFALERMGVTYKATAHLKSPFDPEDKRVKGIYGWTKPECSWSRLIQCIWGKCLQAFIRHISIQGQNWIHLIHHKGS